MIFRLPIFSTWLISNGVLLYTNTYHNIDSASVLSSWMNNCFVSSIMTIWSRKRILPSICFALRLPSNCDHLWCEKKHHNMLNGYYSGSLHVHFMGKTPLAIYCRKCKIVNEATEAGKPFYTLLLSFAKISLKLNDGHVQD